MIGIYIKSTYTHTHVCLYRPQLAYTFYVVNISGLNAGINGWQCLYLCIHLCILMHICMFMSIGAYVCMYVHK